MKNFVHIFFLSCKQATFLIEKRLRKSLTVKEICQLGIHLFICKLCNMYNRKAAFLDKVMRIQTKKEETIDIFSDDEVDGFNRRLIIDINEKERK